MKIVKVGLAAIAVAILVIANNAFSLYNVVAGLDGEESASLPSRLAPPMPDSSAANRRATEGLPRSLSSRSSVSAGAQRTWLAEQQTSTDLARFVRESAVAAFEGDVEAQLAIARATYICEIALGASRNVSQLPISFSLQAERCEDWDVDVLFQELPPSDRGYDLTYWMEMAVEANHPAALGWDAANRVGEALYSQPEMDEISATLRELVESKDPVALHYVGVVLGADSREDRTLRAMAWGLYACRSTACEAAPELQFWDVCTTPAGPTCDKYSMMLYEVGQELGSATLSQIQALSYQIESSIEREAWDELDLNLRAHSPPPSK